DGIGHVVTDFKTGLSHLLLQEGRFAMPDIGIKQIVDRENRHESKKCAKSHQKMRILGLHPGNLAHIFAYALGTPATFKDALMLLTVVMANCGYPTKKGRAAARPSCMNCCLIRLADSGGCPARAAAWRLPGWAPPSADLRPAGSSGKR